MYSYFEHLYNSEADTKVHQEWHVARVLHSFSSPQPPSHCDFHLSFSHSKKPCRIPRKELQREISPTFFWWVSGGSRQTAYFGNSKSLSQVARGMIMVITVICRDVASQTKPLPSKWEVIAYQVETSITASSTEQAGSQCTCGIRFTVATLLARHRTRSNLKIPRRF